MKVNLIAKGVRICLGVVEARNGFVMRSKDARTLHTSACGYVGFSREKHQSQRGAMIKIATAYT